MKLTATMLRKIIAEEVNRVVVENAAAAELEASAGDWVEDNYDAILAKLQTNPKLVDETLRRLLAAM